MKNDSIGPPPTGVIKQGQVPSIPTELVGQLSARLPDDYTSLIPLLFATVLCDDVYRTVGGKRTFQ